MAGILDSKTRVIDAILTSEGRRQMGEGTFRVSFVTFTDADVAYIPDSSAGHVDPAGKIYLEACNLPQDQVVFEANDDGKLNPLRDHDIRIPTIGGNVSGSFAQGVIKDGRLSIYQFHHGRRIKVGFIEENADDLNRGFIYSDVTGLTASVLIRPGKDAGLVEYVVPPPGEPHVAYIGTRGGMGPQQFATSIDTAIKQIRSLGGPDVVSSTTDNAVFLDTASSSTGALLFATGSLPNDVLSLDLSPVGGMLLTDEVESATFASQMKGILTSSLDNYQELQTISSIDPLFMDDSFTLSSNAFIKAQNEISFDISKIGGRMKTLLKTTPPNLNAIDSLFSDDKLSHLENFMYLPPIVKVSDSIVTDKTKYDNFAPYLLGNYPSWGDNEKKLTYTKLQSQLEEYGPSVDVYFQDTSHNNNVIAQFFEVSGKTVSKLDVVDFGPIEDDTGHVMGQLDAKHVFFVGKTYIDNRGTNCFVNMFTLIFSRIGNQ